MSGSWPAWMRAPGGNRRSILNTFKNTWEHGIDVPVRDVTLAQLEIWLAEQQARMSKTSLSSYFIVLC